MWDSPLQSFHPQWGGAESQTKGSDICGSSARRWRRHASRVTAGMLISTISWQAPAEHEETLCTQWDMFFLSLLILR